MKKWFIILLIILMAMPVSAQTLEVNIDFLSQYNLRGMKFSKGSVVQPTVVAVYESLTGLVFANYDTKCSFCNEVDFVLDYGCNIKDISFSLGYGHYTYPNTMFSISKELRGAIVIQNIINSRLSFAHDFGAGAGS